MGRIIEVVLDRSRAVYRAGSVISGSVVVRFDNPKSCHSITVVCHGEGFTHWNKQKGIFRWHFHGREEYLNLNQVLWTKESNSETGGMHPAGEYTYDFHFQVPSNLPTFFYGDFGWIRYSLEGRIVTGSMKFDHTHSVRISIGQLVNLNGSEHIHRPVQCKKMASAHCCTSDPIVYSVQIPRTGFCVGDSIDFSATIANTSSRCVTAVASLKQNVTYTSFSGEQHNVSTTLTKVRSDSISSKSTLAWAPQEGLSIPGAIHPSSLGYGKIIKISYVFCVKIKLLKGLASSRLSIPIVLGNVPIQSVHDPPPPYTTTAQ